MAKSDRLACSCGKPAHIIVEGVPLCDESRAGWLTEEYEAGIERRVQDVMNALDRVCDQEADPHWDDHLRRMALAAIEAAGV